MQLWQQRFGRRVRRSVSSAVLSTLMVTTGVFLGLTTSTAGAAPASGSPLVFGVVATQTGPQGTPEQGGAMQAYADYWNAHGGYKGHKIVVDIVDGSTTASQTTAAARQLVASDNVLAMIQNYDLQDCLNNTSYYASIPIGVVDAEVGGGCYNSSVDFPTEPPNGTVGVSVAMKYGIEQGSKSFGLMVPDIPQVNSLTTAMTAFAAKVHKPLLIKEVRIQATAADFDAVYAQMKAAHVDEIIPLVLSPSLALQEAVTQGFGPANGVRWVFPGLMGTTGPAALPGAYLLLGATPWDSTNPAIVQARKILKSKGVKLDSLAAEGYQAMGILQETLDTLKGPVTRASVLQALRHDHHVLLPLTPEYTNPPDANTNAEGGYIEKSVGGQWKLVTGYI